MLYKAIVSLPIMGGDNENESVNNWWFASDAGSEATSAVGDQLVFVDNALAHFYGSGHGGQPPLTNWLSEAIDRTNCRITIYNAEAMREPDPEDRTLGPPIWMSIISTMTDQAVGGFPLPDQVAARLSWRAGLDYQAVTEDVEAGPAGPAGNIHPRARRRGGIYLGPLQSSCVDSLGSGDQQTVAMKDGFRASCIAALQDLSGQVHAASGCRWVHWSQADLIERVPVAVWVDGRFDTQRRRGSRTSQRALTAL
jgi:hypothetical protein